jgi:hypothetical protein
VILALPDKREREKLTKRSVHLNICSIGNRTPRDRSSNRITNQPFLIPLNTTEMKEGRKSTRRKEDIHDNHHPMNDKPEHPDRHSEIARGAVEAPVADRLGIAVDC